MKWFSWSFNFSNFIRSRFHMFGCIDVLKKLWNVHKKTTVLECALIKFQAANLHSETLIRNETPAHFTKILRTPFFVKKSSA